MSGDATIEQAIALARRLQQRAAELQTSAERRQQAELDRMIQSPADKATLIEITDQAFRSERSARSADQLVHILDVQGIPRFFSALDRTLLRGFQSFGAYLPGVAMPLVKDKIEQETANVVLPAEEELLRDHLEARRREGLRMNVNFLGEALLGERDAQTRLQHYLAALQRPEIEVVSVKISTIYSQISPLARDHTIAVLCDRLELLYRAAARGQFTRADGTVVPKFVYLDMEEYRDKEITAAAFMRTLDRPGLEQVGAGIALQAYIPDSFATQREITEWARRRVGQGGAPVTIRLVKGANMEMERVEASLRRWPLAPFDDKLDTDANYHRMLQYGMQPENLAAVRLGVASHNLFTLAYGLTLAAAANRPDHVQFEMLEGMANHQRRALVEVLSCPIPLAEKAGERGEFKSMLLYAPACRQEDFINAIGYLIRRLDENTGEDNFLRHAFALKVDSPEWRRLEEGFRNSFERIATLPDAPRRTQDRNKQLERAGASSPPAPFANEPDTDWSLPANSEWAPSIIASWQPRHGERAADVPLVIAGDEIHDDREVRPSHDPSRPGVIVANYRQANADDIERAVRCAADDPAGWRRRRPSERTAALRSVADELARRRGDLMGAMLAEGGKLLAESDPEVSDAIDFCRFYALSAEQIYGHIQSLPSLPPASGLQPPVAPRGVVAVVSPWNFPLAIPCGGVAAALAAGNTVILKPASDTVLIAYLLCECFWQAGVPRTALQFAPCSGSREGQQLVAHDAVDAVILTGGTETARHMLARKPTMHLLAETGGKNATIVTALSDRDLAIKNVLHSAFSHSGQKCSATSLLIVEDEVYHDTRFRDTLIDAVESLAVGSAWELPTRVGPLIRPPAGTLERGLKELEPGESWAVMPRLHVDDNPQLVSPGVKWGVLPGSFTHETELFGPVLGVMRAKDLSEAIDLVNATGYGLTSGLESLDDREQRRWQEGIRAGNLYINRPTTGAIVLRQPFGGMGKSAFGPGIKAGGPNYVVPLMNFADAPPPNHQRTEASPPPAPTPTPPPSKGGTRGGISTDRRLSQLCNALAAVAPPPFLAADDCNRLQSAIDSYLQYAAAEFNRSHDPFRLLGEDNFRRYLPVARLALRVAAEDSPFDIIARTAAAIAAGCRPVISKPPQLKGAAAETVDLIGKLCGQASPRLEIPASESPVHVVEQSDEELAEALRSGQIERVRYAARNRVPELVRRAAAESFAYIADEPVLAHGRIELLWYVREQSISHAYHRYGNLGRRAQ